MVEATGLEPTTSWSLTKRATKLRYASMRLFSSNSINYYTYIIKNSQAFFGLFEKIFGATGIFFRKTTSFIFCASVFDSSNGFSSVPCAACFTRLCTIKTPNLRTNPPAAIDSRRLRVNPPHAPRSVFSVRIFFWWHCRHGYAFR